MKWSKATNYMLVMCIYRQSKLNANDKRQINWDAVVDLVNATFTKFPSFVRSYPNGVGSKRLQGQYGGRHRPHATRPSEHKVSHWALEEDSITVAEEVEFTGHLDDLVEAERRLDLDPNSEVRINTEEPRVWCIEFNVAESSRDWEERYVYDYAAEDETDSPDSQGGEQEPEDEEMSEGDVENSDQVVQGDEVGGDESQEDEIMYEEPTPAGSNPPPSPANRHRLDDNGHLTGNGDSETPASIPELINASDIARRASDLAGAAPAVQNARRRAPVARSRPNQRRLTAEHSQVARSNHSSPLMDTFTHLISRLNAWPEIPTLHTSKVDRNPALAMVSTHSILSGPVSPEEIFVSSNDPIHSAEGAVQRIWFHDHTTDQWAEVDVLLCDERPCAVCESSHVPTSAASYIQHGQMRPVVSEEDLVMVPGQGLTFQPGHSIHGTDIVQPGNRYISHVMFTGGKRVLVDIVHQPVGDEVITPRPDILDFLS